jgi:hypothetical protein
MEDRPPDASDPVSPSASWTPPPPPPPSDGPPPLAVIPWEDPARPWTSSLIETIKLLFTRPREAFERMPVTGGVLRPFVFAIIVGWIGMIFNAIWSLSMRGMMPSSGDYARYQMPAVWLPFTAACAPLLIVIALLIATAIDHLFLMIVGGAKNGIAATLRALCYAQAPSVFLILPFCGGPIAGIGTLVLTIIGLSAAHRISTGRAAVAVLLPAVLCCTCMAILFATVGAALWSHFGNGMGR